jgi:exo-beta-1,3-glucanase (GH17 family)
MKPKHFTVAATALLLLAAISAHSQAILTNITSANSFKPFVGIGYSPFQGGQSPNYGTYPTVDEISYDLTNNLKYLASEIRTFGMDGTQSNIVGLCYQYNIKCFPCAYLNPDDPTDNSNELNALIAVANQNYPTTRGLIVGTEPLRIGYDPNMLISNIDYVRAATHTNIPIGTADITYYLADNPAVVANLDFVMINLHPYYAEVTITNAAAWTLGQYQYFCSQFPGKQVLIGETGWPTYGTNVYWSDPEVVPSVPNQEIYLSQFTALAKQYGIEYFIFDYRDELWKDQGEGGTVEQNWGLFDTNSVKKASLVDFLATNFSISMTIAKTNSTTMTVNTFENDPYTLLSTTNLLAGTEIPITNFFGTPGTNQTVITVPVASGQPVNFFSARQNF